MKTAYWILRFCGYAGNLAGIALFVVGRREASNTLVAWGGGLIGAGFAAFIASYAIYLSLKLRRLK